MGYNSLGVENTPVNWVVIYGAGYSKAYFMIYEFYIMISLKMWLLSILYNVMLIWLFLYIYIIKCLDNTFNLSIDVFAYIYAHKTGKRDVQTLGVFDGQLQHRSLDYPTRVFKHQSNRNILRHKCIYYHVKLKQPTKLLAVATRACKTR